MKSGISTGVFHRRDEQTGVSPFLRFLNNWSANYDMIMSRVSEANELIKSLHCSARGNTDCHSYEIWAPLHTPNRPFLHNLTILGTLFLQN